MLARLSVKKPYTVIVAIILVIALGAISFLNMTSDLLPSMDLPYVIVYTVNTGSTPEAIENTITRPLESAFSTLTNIRNVNSTSSENLSLIILEFNTGSDMNTAMIEISSEVDQVSGSWDDSISTPVIMKLNPDMLPVTIAAVNMKDADLLTLSDFVEDVLIPSYEAVDGVASVTASGVMTQQVDITIEQSRIDTLNSAILREIDSKLANTEQKLLDAKSQLRSGKLMLSSARSDTLSKIDEAISAIDNNQTQLPVTVAALQAQREQLIPQLDAAKAALTSLESIKEMSNEEKAAVMQVGENLSALESQRKQLQKQIDAGETTDAAAILQAQLTALQAQRERIAALRANEQNYISSLQLLDKKKLEDTISSLESKIKSDNESLSKIRNDLENALSTRDDAQRQLNDLDARITELEPAYDPDSDSGSTDPSTESSADTSAAKNDNNTETTPAVQPTAASTSDPTELDDTSTTENTSDNTSETPHETESEQQGTSEHTADTNTDKTPDPDDSSSSSEDTSVSDGESQSGNNTEPESEKSPEKDSDSKPVPENKPESESKSEPESKPEPASEPVSQGEQIARNFNLFSYAYADGETLEELKRERAAVKAAFDKASADVDTLTEQHDALRETLTADQTTLEAAKESLAELEEGNIAVQEKIDAANERVTAYDVQIAELDSNINAIRNTMASGDESAAAAAALASLDAQITAIKDSDAYRVYLLASKPSDLKAQYNQASAAVQQLEAAIASIDDMIVKLEQGIIPGGLIDGMPDDTKLSDARTTLTEARSTAISAFSSASSKLSEAEKKLSDGWSKFVEARDEALENAGIDGIITVNTISSILGAQNIDLPAGYVSDDEGRYLVSVGTEFASLSELKQTKLFSLGMDTVDDIRLLDVASVTISDNSEDLFTLLNGQDGIMLSFEKQSTASTAEVAKLITDKSKSMMEKYPGLDVIELMNQGDYIDLIVDSVLQNLLYGGGLAILILLLFLMDWRPTFIVAVSIPVSVVIAFVGMYFCNITLNVMSLSGLALGVGMLVDNSIVAIENIYRLRNEEHLPILTSCIKGVKQVGGALVASTLTTVCIFLPIVFITGTARDLFGDMGLTFAFSLLASLLVAMTVVPSFSATLFRNSKMKEHRFFAKIQQGYTVLLRGALRAKLPVLLLAAGVFVYTCMQVPKMPMSLMPSVNSSQMQGSLSFSEDTDLSDSEQQTIASEIMNAMLDIDGVSNIGLSSSSSISMLSSLSGGSSGGYSYYILVEEGLRDNTDIASDIKEACSKWTNDGDVVLTIKESTMDMSAMTGSGISINIAGTNIEDMRRAATEVAELCTHVEGTANIDDGSSEAEPKLMITVDKQLASDAGTTVAQVYQYIAQRLYGGVNLTEATLDNREYTLYVYTDKDIDLAPADLEGMEMEIKSANTTKHILVGDIATITEGESLESISRKNQKRTVTVSFDIADGYSSNLVSRDLEALLDGYTPPTGCSISLEGENEKLMEYTINLVEMLAIAILFIFLIMAAQFQSFKSPIIVMFTIPLAFTGGLLALLLTGMDLSIISMVGFLMLSGVVVNNGIVFIDSVNQLRIGGMAKRDALVETGRIRLRPILMSVLTTVLGMITMAFGTGMGAEMMQPMAIVTIGGLIYSTLMTLFVVPALYDIFNGEKMKAREIEMIKEASGMKREGFEEESLI